MRAVTERQLRLIEPTKPVVPHDASKAVVLRVASKREAKLMGRVSGARRSPQRRLRATFARPAANHVVARVVYVSGGSIVESCSNSETRSSSESPVRLSHASWRGRRFAADGRRVQSMGRSSLCMRTGARRLRGGRCAVGDEIAPSDFDDAGTQTCFVGRLRGRRRPAHHASVARQNRLPCQGHVIAPFCTEPRSSGPPA